MIAILILPVVVALNLDSAGNIDQGRGPMRIVAHPAGPRDDDCARLVISARYSKSSKTHSFCRSARVYIEKKRIIVIDDNVNISGISIYGVTSGRISVATYTPNKVRLSAISALFFSSGLDHNTVNKIDVIIRLSNAKIVGPETALRRCLELGNYRTKKQ